MILLQAAAGGGFGNIGFMLVLMVIFWYFMIRPQMKAQKEQKKFESSIEKGMEVVTNSGILGKVTKVEDGIITLEVAPKVYMKFTRGAISKDLTNAVYPS